MKKIAEDVQMKKILEEYEDENGEYNLQQLAVRNGVSKTSIFRLVPI